MAARARIHTLAIAALFRKSDATDLAAGKLDGRVGELELEREEREARE